MQRIGMGDSGSAPGGAGALAVIIGVPAVAIGGGALIGGPNHRLLGGLIGLAVGVAAVGIIGKVGASMPAPALPPVTALQTGVAYQLSSVSGGDVTAAASAAGFTNVGPNASGSIIGTWSGANGATVPAGIVAKQ